MLQLIKIKNFQSIKEAIFELGKVTVIVGKSDVGKSAVVRAINSFLENDFPEDYAHKGEYPFGVAIKKDNKVALGRRTTKGVEYIYNNITHTKSNKKVPEEILNFLGIHPYQIDKDISILINIQSQFDTPFLLKDKSTTVAKLLGKISNLNIVMVAVRKMNADLISKKQDLNITNSHLSSEEEKLKNYSNLDDKGVILSKVKTSISSFVSDESLLKEYTDFCSEIKANNKSLFQKEEEVTALSSLLNSVATSYLEKSYLKLEVLENLFIDSSSLTKDIAVFKKKTSLIYSFDVEVTEKAILKYDSLIFIKELLDILTKDISSYKEGVQETNLAYAACEEELGELLKGESICPFSLGSFHQDCKDLILKTNVD